MNTTSFLTPMLQRHAAETEAAILQLERDIIASLRGSLLGGASKAVPAPAPNTVRAGKAAKRGKRSPEELELLTRKLQAYISKNPGQRIEQIGAAMGVSTKALVLPVKKLLGEKKLTTKGQKRATTYSAK